MTIAQDRDAATARAAAARDATARAATARDAGAVRRSRSGPLRTVLAAFRAGTPSVAEIAARTGLDRDVVTAAVDHLARAGYLRLEPLAMGCPPAGCGGCPAGPGTPGPGTPGPGTPGVQPLGAGPQADGAPGPPTRPCSAAAGVPVVIRLACPPPTA